MKDCRPTTDRVFQPVLLMITTILTVVVIIGGTVAKMASHAIFQYNVLVIDIDNTTLGLI